jgi:hypothetical protein
MRRHELHRLAEELAAEVKDVAITVTVPTHRHPPESQQDPVRLRKAARSASSALDGLKLTDHDLHAIRTRLEALPSEVERQIAPADRGLGVACYLTPTLTRVVSLSHTPPERVIIADEFSLAAPITDITTADDIDVIVLSTGGNDTPGARLYRLEQGRLSEHSDDVLPMDYDIRDRETRFNAEGRPDASKRDGIIENFLRAVDRHLATVFGSDHDRAVVVAGVERLRSHFAAVRSGALSRAIIAEIDGNFDHVRDAELAQSVQKAVDATRQRMIADDVAGLTEIPPQLLTTALDDIRQLALEGRVHRLLVTEGATDEVTIDGVVIGDRIARTIRACFDSDASISFVPPGALRERGDVIAVLRW